MNAKMLSRNLNRKRSFNVHALTPWRKNLFRIRWGILK